MKLNNKLIIGSLVLAGGIGLGQHGPVHRTNGCETYQGYTHDEGQRIFVFDEETLKNREGRGPNYALSGDPGMHRNLEMGKEYRLEIREPRLPVFSTKRLLSFEDCPDSE